MDRETGCVTQDPAQVDGMLAGEIVLRDLPRLQQFVDVLIELQNALLDEF